MLTTYQNTRGSRQWEATS